eukprot:NODE_11581_length_1277_cov_3.672174.p1 GENE.NODE_11581_length_1277_cov_3.672174~~NODE_11581_length_1277_cov_3.672174.p1  ORF type:complete len:265 (-),score=17.65 NODE_11581_length_1277_cov_3.672174:251-1045(-)
MVHARTPTPRFSHECLAALHQVIEVHMANQASSDERLKFFGDLQKTAVADTLEKAHHLNDPKAIATRLWSCDKQCRGRELCSILNEAIRNDINLEHVMVLAKLINLLCLGAELDSGISIRQSTGPAANLAHKQVFRGGGLPDEYRSFFEPRREYRAPMFIVTTWLKDRVALKTFARYAQERSGRPPVLYVFYFGRDGCVHVNYLGEGTLQGQEAELLFVPYSVFTVRQVIWQDAPTYLNPHLIELDVAPDNRLRSEDLPLAPWH